MQHHHSSDSYPCSLSGMDDSGDYDLVEFDHQTQMRLDSAVDRVLKGYDWTLAPLAQK